MNTEPEFTVDQLPTTIAIVGVGLIGGSIAAALKSRQYSGQIVGVGRNAARLETAKSQGLIDRVSTDHTRIAADLMIFCTPVPMIVSQVQELAEKTSHPTLITDAGSTKQTICGALCNTLPDHLTFIGSHPLAGSEKQGFEHAEADLFQNRVCVITPDAETSPEPLRIIQGFWQSIGMRVYEMTAAQHDLALAQTSHLPHVLAAALAGVLQSEFHHLTATGFRDTSRVAAGDPELWVGILENNATKVRKAIGDVEQLLQQYQLALETGNSELLRSLLQQAKENRDAL